MRLLEEEDPTLNRDPRGFLTRVKDAAKFDTIKEADEATRATLRSMRSVLSSDQRNRLSQSLPGPYASELQSDEADGDPDIDRETFIGRMMSNFPTQALGRIARRPRPRVRPGG